VWWAHAGVIAEHASARLAVVVDADVERAKAVADRYGELAATDLSALDACDAVVVVCATEVHREVALALLADGRPLLVEKPLAPTLDDARAIVDAASAAGLPLTCGFVERFNPSVVTALGLVSSTPLQVMSVRHSPVVQRMATSVVSDLLIHDIDLALLCFGQPQPVSSRLP
jgi:predicted dehydrogenase